MGVSIEPPFEIRTVDLTAHPIAFASLALVPVSDAGRDWLEATEFLLGGAAFTPADACMTGFPADAIGFEPQDWPEIATAARDAGLIVEGAI